MNNEVKQALIELTKTQISKSSNELNIELSKIQTYLSQEELDCIFEKCLNLTEKLNGKIISLKRSIGN